MKVSLGFILALSLAGLQFIAITTVVLTTYFSTETAMLKHARELLRDAGTSVIDHSVRFLEPAAEAASLSSRLAESGLVNPDDTAAMENFLFQHLQTAPQLNGAYYGDEAGNFVFVMREEQDDVFRTKIVDRSGADRTTELIWRDAGFVVGRRANDPTDDFDPRSRPWYDNAKKSNGSIAWTDPYIFFSSQQPGVSVSAPVTDRDQELRGVIGVDIEISEISSFLADLNVGQSGTALIVDRFGRVVAHPDPVELRKNKADGLLDFSHITEIDDPVTRAAFANATQSVWGIDSSVEVGFDYDRQSYLMLAQPIKDFDLQWTIVIFAPEDDFISGIKDNRRRNIWLALLISVISALVGLALAELILRPVRAFAVRTSLVSQGEVSANETLPRTYRELDRANQTLIREIAQRRDSEFKVKELSRDLTHFSRINLLGQMATGLAHELSQPLTAITQNVDTAKTIANTECDKDSPLLDILQELDEQAHRGGDVVHALRGLVRRDEDSAHPFDFADLVRQTTKIMRHEADLNDIEIEYVDTKIPPVIGNPVQIAQVLINVMRNAIDAISTAGSRERKVTITPVLSDDSVEIQVADTGPGISPDVTLFKRFETNKPNGMGLGLSICKGIIEENGGKMWYESEGLETGYFCFTLPV